jgi:L-alanine-DL-glutamate epimerase-like enolase superfamily enzyme
VSTWERLAELPVEIEECSLEGLSALVSSDFERKSTVIRLRGAGAEGLGEDVTYDAVDHEILQADFDSPGGGGPLPLAGRFTIASFAERIAELDLFPRPPQREVSRRYRVWAYESAALDLALRQAGTTLHAALEREPRPVRFVVSLRLGEPPSMDPLNRRLSGYPSLRFKLDPTSSWDAELIARLAATGAVESVDFKAYYSGSIVDQPADPELYERVVRALPRAWIEDPALTPETDAVLAGDRERFSWDAPIHSVADIEALTYPPRMVNIKPSRLGGLRNLLDAFDYCAQRGIGNYGGGQFELGVGRGQIQYLASLFHADAPNDVAPTGYNLPEPPAGLPDSPLPATPAALGFRWEPSPS